MIRARKLNKLLKFTWIYFISWPERFGKKEKQMSKARRNNLQRKGEFTTRTTSERNKLVFLNCKSLACTFLQTLSTFLFVISQETWTKHQMCILFEQGGSTLIIDFKHAEHFVELIAGKEKKGQRVQRDSTKKTKYLENLALKTGSRQYSEVPKWKDDGRSSV